MSSIRFNEELPKNKLIRLQLEEELLNGRWKAHDHFYSESALKERFRVSVPTIRVALKELMGAGLIYRQQGRGTFVSPKMVKSQILIVGTFSKSLIGQDIGIQKFLGGFLGEPFSNREHYTPIVLTSDHFANRLPDLTFHYPNAKAVLFFRDAPSALASEQILKELGIPFLFYGSQSLQPSLGEIPSFCYDERKIVEMGMEYLLGKYGPRISFALREGIRSLESRKVIYEEWMTARGYCPNVVSLGSVHDEVSVTHEKTFSAYQTCVETTDALFCADDWVALFFNNAALRNCKFGEDILPLLGVNDYPICSVLYPTLSSIRIPLEEDSRRCLGFLTDWIEGKASKIDVFSHVKLIARMSA